MITVAEKLVLENLLENAELKGSYDFFRDIVHIEDCLKEAGFECEVLAGKHVSNESDLQNQNRIYKKQGSEIALVIVDNPKNNVYYPVLLDREIYDRKLKGKTIFINHSSKKTEQGARANVKVKINGENKNIKLHRYVLDQEFSVDKDVDHITHSLNSCLVSDLRVCSTTENFRNKRFRSHIVPNHCKFTVRVQVDSLEKELLKEDLEDLGFEFTGIDTKDGNVYLCKSPEFSGKQSMLYYLNKIENKFFESFRYNPLLDYSNPVSSYLYILSKIEALSKDDLTRYNKAILEKLYGKFIFEYYEIAA